MSGCPTLHPDSIPRVGTTLHRDFDLRTRGWPSSNPGCRWRHTFTPKPKLYHRKQVPLHLQGPNACTLQRPDYQQIPFERPRKPWVALLRNEAFLVLVLLLTTHMSFPSRKTFEARQTSRRGVLWSRSQVGLTTMRPGFSMAVKTELMSWMSSSSISS